MFFILQKLWATIDQQLLLIFLQVILKMQSNAHTNNLYSRTKSIKSITYLYHNDLNKYTDKGIEEFNEPVSLVYIYRWGSWYLDFYFTRGIIQVLANVAQDENEQFSDLLLRKKQSTTK